MGKELKNFVLKNGIRIAYTDSGEESGTVILFIHGLANYHAVWNSNIHTLQQHYRCISVDLPGNGESGRNYPSYTMDFYADAMCDFVQEMKLKDVVPAGHSMGGLIVLKMALAGKVSFRKMLLFAPAGFEYYSPHESILFKSAIAMGNFLNLDETQVTQSVRNSFYKQSTHTEQIVRDLTAIIQRNNRAEYRLMLEQSIHAMLDEEIFSKLKLIRQQSLVFFGENDMLIPNRFLHPVSTKELALKAVAEMSGAKLITYKDTGHFVQIERAEQVNKEVLAFLK